MEFKAKNTPCNHKYAAYADFDPEDLIVRDLLALDRTELANERTLLSNIRTAFVVAASGVTLIELLPENPLLFLLGWILLPSGLAILINGYYRYRKMRKELLTLQKPREKHEHDRQS